MIIKTDWQINKIVKMLFLKMWVTSSQIYWINILSLLIISLFFCLFCFVFIFQTFTNCEPPFFWSFPVKHNTQKLFIFCSKFCLKNRLTIKQRTRTTPTNIFMIVYVSNNRRVLCNSPQAVTLLRVPYKTANSFCDLRSQCTIVQRYRLC